MKKITALFAAVGLCFCFAAYAADDAKPDAPAAAAPAAAPAAKADPKDLATPEAKVSYIVGFNLAKDLAERLPVDLDMDSFVMGMKESQAEKPCRVTTEMQAPLQQEVMEKAKAEAAAAGEKNKKEGEEFLAKNGKKEGVKTTKSGLQYSVVKEGTGPSPKATDKVHVNYTGTFVGGKKFDSSDDHPEQPAIFSLAAGGVVPGFSEALQLMKVGSKFSIAMPGDLAYGEKASRKIGPNRTLLFEIELLEILPADKPDDMGGMGGMGMGDMQLDAPAPKAKPATK